MFFVDIIKYLNYKQDNFKQIVLKDEKRQSSKKFKEFFEFNMILCVLYPSVFIWGLTGKNHSCLI